jgi:multidrug transporter EmrE-like cation transporter
MGRKKMVYLNIAMFLLFQVAANLLFKWGGTAPQRYWWGFVFGNAVGMTSILFLIGMYRTLPAATVVAIASGGAFLMVQLALYLVYREALYPAAVAGMILIFVGILMTALLNRPLTGSAAHNSETVVAADDER